MAFAIDDLDSVVAHWSADQVTGSPGDGDAVGTLPDSIASWDMIGVTTKRPLYRTAGINSLPTLDFDGVDDFMITASKAIDVPNCVVAEVFRIDVLQHYNAAFFLGTTNAVPTYAGSTTKVQHLTGYVDGHVMYGGINGVFKYNISEASLTAAFTDYVVITGYSQHNFWQRINGVTTSVNSNASAGSPDCSSFTAYASFGDSSLSLSFDGDLAEIVLFEDGILSEATYIEGFLADKYGITLPTSHPFYNSPPASAPGGGGILRVGMNGGISG